MKVVVNKKHEVVCYVQLRDLIYIVNEITEYRKLVLKYMDQVDTIDDFVKVTDEKLISVIKDKEDIIDFHDFSSYSIEDLSHLLIVKKLFCDNNSRNRVNHEARDIQDLILYKKGELRYNIPLIADDRIVLNVNGYKVFSTTFNNKFIIECSGDVYCDFVYLIDELQKNAKEKGLLLPDVEYSYKIIDVNENKILVFIPLEKKKNKGIQFLLNRKKNKDQKNN